MPLSANCPRCHRQVTIPDGLDPAGKVRCPLCAVVYRLEEALAGVPPALIPVETGAIDGPRPDADAMAESDLILERYHVAESAAIAEPAADETPALDAWRKVDVAPDIDTGVARDGSLAADAAEASVDSDDALASLGIKEPEETYEPVAAGLSTRCRRRKGEKGVVRFMAEVILGGCLGLLIGYYALCWISGPQHRLPKLPLPLLPHTMHWFRDSGKQGNGEKQPVKEHDVRFTGPRSGA